MRFTSLLAAATALLGTASAWTLTDNYQGNTFFDGFTFFTGPDPTHGTVQYVDRATAESQDLIAVGGDGVVIMKADMTNVTPNGRPSVRISSNKTYNSGLFILDVKHMPFGCGTWPAAWMVGPNWPAGGEIDIIEGVNTQGANQMTLHTSEGCTMDTGASSQTGNWITTNCYVNAPGQSSNQGCGVGDPSSNSYGDDFNANEGGVFATKWEPDSGIQIWFFPRGSIPGDISSGNPDPSSWGTPKADFPFTSCSSSYFSDMVYVFDLTFCGDWAGASGVYNSQYGCPSTCSDYVINNPTAFTEAYWAINYLKVYQQ